VLKAFEEVERHLFVKEENTELAYENYPLPIGYNQTISQPFITALMTELLHPAKDEFILEIGTGSGYQTAILSKLAKFVVSVERVRELVEYAKNNLKQANIENVSLKFGDGTLGWRDSAPYDGIIVTAGTPEIPEALLNQLKVGGRMVIPVGENGVHNLKLILKEEDGIVIKDIIDCVFVPLIGRGIGDGK
jgi:protein-L-isoaspartate(D-aspartate) O-methyltransferase